MALPINKPGNSFCVNSTNDIYANKYSTINYFSPKCKDPYTMYNFHYRRYANQNQYLNCSFLPYKEPRYFYNKWGYIKPGNNCQNCGNNEQFNVVDGRFRYYQTPINFSLNPIVRV